MERSPLLPHHPFEPLRSIGSCPGEDGKGPGRTKRCGGAVMYWMRRIYAFSNAAQEGGYTNVAPCIQSDPF